MVGKLINIMSIMFFMMMTGLVLKRKNIITEEGKKCLTDLILIIIIPCNIVKAFSNGLNEEILTNFIPILGMGVFVQTISLMSAKFLFGSMTKIERPSYQYGMICPNSGFIGNPLAEGVFGQVGLAYAAVHLIPLRIVMWTAGVGYFTDGKNKKEAYKKILTHPCMVATYIGLLIMILGINLPNFLKGTVIGFSNCTTGLTLLYVGTILADIDIKNLVDKSSLYYCFLRLIAIPIIIYIMGKILNLDPIVIGVSVLLAATPAGSTTSLLAAKYKADEVSAAKLVVLSTILSIMTIPIWSMALLKDVI